MRKFMFRLCSVLVLSRPMVSLRSQSGFSLVELSIVLVILGLLTGGILGGQALIRAAELRAVSTEYNRWVTATQTFRDKYFALPGDMTNATAFWGKDGTACNTDVGAVGSPGTCNGNGSGTLEGAVAVNGTGEIFQFWSQLSLAGLIEGSYTGLSGPGGTGGGGHVVPGSNAPISKLRPAGWGIRYNLTLSGPAEFTGSYNHWLQFGSNTGTWDNGGRVLRPEEAWNIDQKIDDGVPGRGKVLPRYWSDCSNATNQDDLDTTYRLTNTSRDCVLIFRNAF